MDALEYYRDNATKTLANPDKSYFHDKERALLAVIDAELAKHSGGGTWNAPGGADERGPPPPGYGDHEPPPHSDDDIPF